MVTPGKLKRRAQFFEQLGGMIAAGVSLTKALEMAARNRSSGVPRRALQQLIHHLQEGHTFTDAMQLVSGQKRGVQVAVVRHSDFWLSDFDIALLSAGEESGKLDSTFRLLGRYYASRAKIISDTIASSFFTILTLHVFLVIVPLPLLVGFVLGIINDEYVRCVPFIIEKIAVFGGLYGGIWLLGFLTQGNRSIGLRALVERGFSIIPLLRTSVKYLAVARLSMSLDALLSAGVPVIRAWELSAVACGSPKLQREILKWTPELERGSTPSDIVVQIPYFPEMFTQLYHTGEISGKLDETLARLHTYFEEEGFRKLQLFCRLLSFIIYISIAVMVGYFYIKFWTGYFNTMLNAF